MFINIEKNNLSAHATPPIKADTKGRMLNYKGVTDHQAVRHPCTFVCFMCVVLIYFILHSLLVHSARRDVYIIFLSARAHTF